MNQYGKMVVNLEPIMAWWVCFKSQQEQSISLQCSANITTDAVCAASLQIRRLYRCLPTLHLGFYDNYLEIGRHSFTLAFPDLIFVQASWCEAKHCESLLSSFQGSQWRLRVFMPSPKLYSYLAVGRMSRSEDCILLLRVSWKPRILYNKWLCVVSASKTKYLCQHS